MDNENVKLLGNEAVGKLYETLNKVMTEFNKNSDNEILDIINTTLVFRTKNKEDKNNIKFSSAKLRVTNKSIKEEVKTLSVPIDLREYYKEAIKDVRDCE